MGETREAEAVAIIEGRVDAIVEKLTDWARHMVARFNGTVYLVGSTLHNPYGRDIDIRIVIADEEFAHRYDMPMEDVPHEEQERRRQYPRSYPTIRSREVTFEGRVTQRWADDCAKFSGALCKRLEHNVDVKVWPESHWHQPYPPPIVLAAPTPRWFVYTKHCPDPSAPAAVAPPEDGP